MLCSALAYLSGGKPKPQTTPQLALLVSFAGAAVAEFRPLLGSARLQGPTMQPRCHLEPLCQSKIGHHPHNRGLGLGRFARGSASALCVPPLSTWTRPKRRGPDKNATILPFAAVILLHYAHFLSRRSQTLVSIASTNRLVQTRNCKRRLLLYCRAMNLP